MSAPVRLAALAALLLAAWPAACVGGACSAEEHGAVRAGDAALARAFDERVRDTVVEGEGTVVRLLADDTEGARHQRFVVRLHSGQTLLIAHNVDIAPRVRDLRVGDLVAFRGVYEWNAQGGTVHWTHRDPDGSHAAGWVRHEGRTYE